MGLNTFIKSISNQSLLNPFFLYVLSWGCVLILYSFNWSSILPNLKLPLLFFLFITAFIMFVLFLRTRQNKKYLFTAIKVNGQYDKLIKNYLLLSYALLIWEFISFGSIPIFAYSGNVSEDLYWQFGIPLVNVFVVNSFAVICLFSAYCFASAKKRKYVIYVLLSLIPPILCMQRGIAMNQIIGATLIVLVCIKINIKTILFTAIFIIVGLFFFGIMGNHRTKSSETMLVIGQPTNNFLELGIPNEFLWSYIYAASPVGNLQNIINKRKTFPDKSSGIDNFLILSIYPQFIGKHMKSYDDEPKYLIIGSLTVCTTYGKSYVTLGWPGMILMFLYIIVLYLFCIKLIDKNSPFRIPLLAVLCIMSVMSVFDNMVHYTGILPQVIILLFLSWIFKKRTINSQ